MSEFKDEWLRALRSGNYRQGQNYLRRENAFCCLGVAADINSHLIRMPSSGLWRTSGDGTRTANSRTHYAGPNGELLLYLDAYNCDVMTACVNMNDDAGKTFAAIADWLETIDF